jgi:hypothetical protein
MATRALTPVAPSGSKASVSLNQVHACTLDWQEVLISDNAELIWQHLHELVEREMPGHDIDAVAQDLFLSLLANDRLTFYIDSGFSEDQINFDILEHLSLVTKTIRPQRT